MKKILIILTLLLSMEVYVFAGAIFRAQSIRPPEPEPIPYNFKKLLERVDLVLDLMKSGAPLRIQRVTVVKNKPFSTISYSYWNTNRNKIMCIKFTSREERYLVLHPKKIYRDFSTNISKTNIRKYIYCDE